MFFVYVAVWSAHNITHVARGGSTAMAGMRVRPQVREIASGVKQCIGCSAKVTPRIRCLPARDILFIGNLKRSTNI